MIFIANVLAMNGGTTFLIRICRELSGRGIKVAVLVLFPIADFRLREEVERYAKVIDLRDFLFDRGCIFRSQLITFAPIRWRKLLSVLRPFGDSVHVMGVFGLLFSSRLNNRNSRFSISLGVYHQNEFLFEAPNTYFIRVFRQCFNSLPAEKFLFFNQINKKNYARFFNRDFSTSVLAPIGIELPGNSVDFLWKPEAGKLVSVGNLVNFKTYNRHVIHVVSELAKDFPSLHYDIYGVGPEEERLKALVGSLNIKACVNFMGVLPYSKFRQVVRRASLFIGSGTSLVEAAVLGVPAMVGIESMQEPETYGFLSDVRGFSYNEMQPEIPRIHMRNLISRLLSDPAYALSVSKKCSDKAKEFSISVTADAMIALSGNKKSNMFKLGTVANVLAGVSFLFLGALDFFGWSTTFRNRRDQSF